MKDDSHEIPNLILSRILGEMSQNLLFAAVVTGTLRVKELFEPVHEISNNVVCATTKASYQPVHTRSLIRAFASRLSIL